MKDGIYSLLFYKKKPSDLPEYSYSVHLFIFQQRLQIATLLACFLLDILINPNW